MPCWACSHEIILFNELPYTHTPPPHPPTHTHIHTHIHTHTHTHTHTQGLLSLLVLTQHTSSTHLPMLLVPTLFTQLYLISSAASTDHTHTTTLTIVMGAALGLLYSLSFYLLPWTISYPLVGVVSYPHLLLNT